MIASLEPGAMLGGDPVSGPRYRVERLIGAGGFGITYLCADLKMGGLVVVKEFAPSGLATRHADGALRPSSATAAEARLARLLTRFRDEAQTLTRIARDSRSPHLVQVIDKWDERGTSYYAMTLIRASGHWPVREDAGPVTSEAWTRVERLAHELLDALETVHDAGIVCHGDLKPANVLLDERDRAVLIDFGTVRTDADVTRTSATVMITPGWAAPELQHRDQVKRAGPWSDLYAWALLVWGAVVRHPTMAYDEDNDREVPWPVDASARALQITGSGPHADPYSSTAPLVGAGVPPAWAAALVGCLSLASDQRPQSVAELRTRLDGGMPESTRGAAGSAPSMRTVLETPVGGTGSHAPLYAPPDPPAAPAGRGPVGTWVALAVAGVALIAVSFVGTTVWMDRAGEAASTEPTAAETPPAEAPAAEAPAAEAPAAEAPAEASAPGGSATQRGAGASAASLAGSPDPGPEIPHEPRWWDVSYRARLSARDHANSNGHRLSSAPAVVRQDRANVHRFRRMDPDDQLDPIFVDRVAREWMPDAIEDRMSDATARAIMQGEPLVEVRVRQSDRRVEVSIISP